MLFTFPHAVSVAREAAADSDEQFSQRGVTPAGHFVGLHHAEDGLYLVEFRRVHRQKEEAHAALAQLAASLADRSLNPAIEVARFETGSPPCRVRDPDALLIQGPKQ
jgi:hypothetical protein